jgi:hypothetical protein
MEEHTPTSPKNISYSVYHGLNMRKNSVRLLILYRHNCPLNTLWNLHIPLRDFTIGKTCDYMGYAGLDEQVTAPHRRKRTDPETWKNLMCINKAGHLINPL